MSNRTTDMVVLKPREDDEVEIMIDVDIENVHEIERNDISYQESVISKQGKNRGRPVSAIKKQNS